MEVTPSGAGGAAQERAAGLFTYLRELALLRSRPVRDIAEHLVVLPLADVPAGPDSGTVLTGGGPAGAWIWLGREEAQPAPDVPEILRGWLAPPKGRGGLERPHRLEQRTTSDDGSERFAADEGRTAAWRDYLRAWDAWAGQVHGREGAEDLYGRVFEFARAVEREGERVELLLCAGLLQWRRDGVEIRRHLLVTDAAVDLDPRSGRLSVIPAGGVPRPSLEEDVLEPGDVPREEAVTRLRDELAGLGDDLLDLVRVGPLLAAYAEVLAPGGTFRPEATALSEAPSRPVISLAPALVLRRRDQRAYVGVYERIVEDLRRQPPTPGVRGLVEPMSDELGEGMADTLAPDGGPARRHLPLPANDEQLETVLRLGRRRGVVVQGPPGTGKSHTIANLVCDLLAEGRRVLVTSQTARALRVLRDKVPPEVAPLCVDALGEVREYQRRLDIAVQAILDRKAGWSVQQSAHRAAELERRRAELVVARERVDGELLALRASEAAEHEAPSGRRGTPSALARALTEEGAQHDWLGEVTSADEPPLSDAEALELLELLRALGPQERARAAQPIPSLARVPQPEEFAAWIRDEDEAARETALQAEDDAARGREMAEAIREAEARAQAAADAVPPGRPVPRNALAAAEEKVAELRRRWARLAGRQEPWLQRAMDDVLGGRADRWRSKSIATHTLLDELSASAAELAGRSLAGVEGRSLPALIEQAQGLVEHLESGGVLKGSLGRRPEPVRRAWELLENVRLDGAPPRDLPTLKLTIEALTLLDGVQRAERTFSEDFFVVRSGHAERRLARLREELGALDTVLQFGELGAELNRELVQMPGFTPLEAADPSSLSELEDQLSRAGETERIRARAVEAAASLEEARRAVEAERSEASARAERRRREAAQAADRRQRLHDVLVALSRTTPEAGKLAQAVAARDPAGYGEAHLALAELVALRTRSERAQTLLERLRRAAPTVGDALAADPADRGWAKRLAGLRAAWDWRRDDEWLRRLVDPEPPRRAGAEAEELERRRERIESELAAELAWQHALGRMSIEEAQHLAAYARSVKSLGNGEGGARAAARRREARWHLERCQAAIPAWIMPLHRVAETFTPDRDRFDVVIVDEASQSGVEALFLFHLAPRVVVVGDDQQISPENVEVDRGVVEELSLRHLAGVPLRSVMGVDESLFDQAVMRFGGRIVLREHFRCMPEIIGFSDNLCYRPIGAPLVPLRQYGAERLSPLVAKRVARAHENGDGRVNRAEAEALADTVAACIADPDYAGRSMGVISLDGNEQARLVERLLLERVGASTIEDRRLRCGDPYAFQGDERDVMFLSMVASAEGGERLRPLTDEASRRSFNVAASRARDQLWLFHSVELDELHPDCVRHRLLSHLLDPPVEEVVPGPEPDELRDDVLREPFATLLEQGVYGRIRSRGFRVAVGQRVHGHRIPLVVVGDRTRVAVECDDERWPGPERAAADLARERDLTRAGWTFWRVRGGAFFRDPERALADLWPLLEQHAIRPEHAPTVTAVGRREALTARRATAGVGAAAEGIGGRPSGRSRGPFTSRGGD
jgi:very-short-patch-repair endonuclease